MGKVVSIGAVATSAWQKDCSGVCVKEYKLGSSLDATSFTMQTDVLHAQSKTISKHYVKPFTARYVRLYVWEGREELGVGSDGKPRCNVVRVRMELYAVVTSFHWQESDDLPRLADHTSAGVVGSDSFCNLTMLDLAPSFEAWTEGMHGDGNIYESVGSQIELGGTMHEVTAYQRNTIKFLGIMGKKVVCFVSDNEQKCCVSKRSSLLGRGPWIRQEAEIKMS